MGLDPLHSYDPTSLLRVIYTFFTGNTISSFFSAAPYFLINLFARFAVFSFFFSIVMLVVVIIYFRKMEQIKKKMMDRIAAHDASKKQNMKAEMVENPKWKLVQEHIQSNDANKWKLAILEADIMLADLLEGLHLPGDTIGDKLKAVDKSDFRTIEEAWEGHKIRNAIAHEGSGFLLNEREAKRVIGLYEKVFREFETIQG